MTNLSLQFEPITFCLMQSKQFIFSLFMYLKTTLSSLSLFFHRQTIHSSLPYHGFWICDHSAWCPLVPPSYNLQLQFSSQSGTLFTVASSEIHFCRLLMRKYCETLSKTQVNRR